MRKRHPIVTKIAKEGAVGAAVMSLCVAGLYIVDKKSGIVLAFIAPVLFVIAILMRWHIEVRKLDSLD